MVWHRIGFVLVLAALVGCARDNPFFDGEAVGMSEGKGGTSMASAGTAGTTTGSPTSGDTDIPPTSDSEHGSSDSVSLSTTEPDTDTVGETVAASDTGACVTDTVEATLAADAFLVTAEICTACADANYGATTEHDMFVGAGIAYYVTRFDGLPFDAQVLSATLSTNVRVQEESDGVAFGVYEFWPGCAWNEGTRDGPGAGEADGITYNHCDPSTDTPFTGNSPDMTVGAALADPVFLGETTGEVELVIELSLDAVENWLAAGGFELIFVVEAPRDVVVKPAREDAATGTLQLAFVVCS